MKKILITPLNWGLGHATRCMPIIDALLEKGCEVIIGTDGRALHLLEKEYPTLEIIELPAYDISYRSNNMMRNIAPQLFKILKVIRKENIAVQKIVTEKGIDAIISDNRYGCYSKNVHSIFMTHQLNIKIPNRLVESGVAFFNQQLIQQFDECWIPDFEDENNSLSGHLSHQHGMKKVTYLGGLSRFKYFETIKQYDILIILSGPEPQRTYLEEKLLKQAKSLNAKTLFVKGKTEENPEPQISGNVTILPFLTAKALNQAILESEIIITRSGYSTIMDLAALGSKAVLIPTPGQTEQEYLADYFHKKRIFHTQSQDDFDLEQALMESQGFTGIKMQDSNALLEAINQLVVQL